SQRLGIKAFEGQSISAGAIICRQHGTRWHAGRNVGIGRDWTIYSLVSGFVRFDRGGRRINVFPAGIKTADPSLDLRVARVDQIRLGLGPAVETREFMSDQEISLLRSVVEDPAPGADVSPRLRALYELIFHKDKKIGSIIIKELKRPDVGEKWRNCLLIAVEEVSSWERRQEAGLQPLLFAHDHTLSPSTTVTSRHTLSIP